MKLKRREAGYNNARITELYYGRPTINVSPSSPEGITKAFLSEDVDLQRISFDSEGNICLVSSQSNTSGNREYPTSSASSTMPISVKCAESHLSVLVSFVTSYELFIQGKVQDPSLIDEDYEQIDPLDLEEIDLQRQMAMLTLRTKSECQRPKKNDRSFVTRQNFYQGGTVLSSSSRQKLYNDRSKENQSLDEQSGSRALVVQQSDKSYDWSFKVNEEEDAYLAEICSDIAFTDDLDDSYQDDEYVDNVDYSLMNEDEEFHEEDYTMTVENEDHHQQNNEEDMSAIEFTILFEDSTVPTRQEQNYSSEIELEKKRNLDTSILSEDDEILESCEDKGWQKVAIPQRLDTDELIDFISKLDVHEQQVEVSLHELVKICKFANVQSSEINNLQNCARDTRKLLDDTANDSSYLRQQAAMLTHKEGELKKQVIADQKRLTAIKEQLREVILRKELCQENSGKISKKLTKKQMELVNGKLNKMRDMRCMINYLSQYEKSSNHQSLAHYSEDYVHETEISSLITESTKQYEERKLESTFTEETSNNKPMTRKRVVPQILTPEQEILVKRTHFENTPSLRKRICGKQVSTEGQTQSRQSNDSSDRDVEDIDVQFRNNKDIQDIKLSGVSRDIEDSSFQQHKRRRFAEGVEPSVTSSQPSSSRSNEDIVSGIEKEMNDLRVLIGEKDPKGKDGDLRKQRREGEINIPSSQEEEEISRLSKGIHLRLPQLKTKGKVLLKIPFHY
uniref:uncharacterized protein LOC122601346 n=1 Tax=Erigeron canadensis TaxID=72917 RepID=UPI001CB98C2C|nr:uncharacterized protein LOC122601346 [Erigeron canadensis]